jgi:DNA-binding NarL/FixJ family response regulator
MTPTQILLVDMPRLLREIIEITLTAQTDMAVVGSVAGDSAGLSVEFEQARVDVVVVGSGNPDVLGRCRDLLSTWPGVKVLGVSDDGRDATFYELQPATHTLGELSPVDLVGAIRAARSRRLAWNGE